MYTCSHDHPAATTHLRVSDEGNHRMTQQSPGRNTTAPYQGVLMEVTLVHATTQAISPEVLLALADKATYDWAQLALQATTAEAAEIVSVAYTALSHERTALTILSKLSLDVIGTKQEDLPVTIKGYSEAIMYVGFAASGWAGVTHDLYEHQQRRAETLDQATKDLCRNLVFDAVTKRNLLIALTYRLAMLQAHLYERLLYPPLTQDIDTHDHA